MRDWHNEEFVRTLTYKELIGFKMGLFGSDTQNIAVSQSAGQTTASVELPIPFWEIVIIVFVVVTSMLIIKNCLKNYFLQQVNKQARIAVISENV
jgi:hypothetical protein